MASLYGHGNDVVTCHCRRGPLVLVFVGDMTFHTGLYHEFAQYANGHSLPIRVILEDNGLSTNTDTKKTWGGEQVRMPTHKEYYYDRTHPHVGLAERVEF